MFFNKLLPLEQPVMENFIRYKLRTIITTIYKVDKGYIKREEVPYLMGYFLQSPSQEQTVNEILPEIEKLESNIDHSKELIEVKAFEKYLIDILKQNKYSNYDKEVLLEAFRVLDLEKNGTLDLHTLYTYLKTYGKDFKNYHISDMENFLVENDNDMFKSLGTKGEEAIKHKFGLTTRTFYYEQYVRKVLGDENDHFETLMREFKEYYDKFMDDPQSIPPLPDVEIEPISKPPQPEKIPEEKEGEEEKKAEDNKGEGKPEEKKDEKKENNENK